MQANHCETKLQSLALFIVVMILTGMFGLLATDIYTPSLPLIPKLYNTSLTLTQLTVGVFIVGLGVTQLIAGMLSDVYGRRPVLIAGLVIFCFGTVLCMEAPNIYYFLMARAIQGVGAGAVAVLSRVLLRDLFSGVQMARIGSYLAAFIALSPALAPVIGGYLQVGFGFKAIFVFLLLFAAIIFYLVQFHLPETNRYKHLHVIGLENIKLKYKRILISKIFLQNVIATGCALSVIISCAVINPFLLQDKLHLSTAQYGLWAFVGMLGIFVGMLLNGYFVACLGGKFMMLMGMLIIFLGGLVFVIFPLVAILSIPAVIVPTFFISLAAAFILPNAVVGAFMPFADIAGTAGAVYGCLQMLITALVSFIISILSVHSLLGLGVILISLASISAIFVSKKYVENF